MKLKGFWKVEWLDRDGIRRFSYPDYDPRVAQKWSAYIRNIGGHVVQMSYVSRKPEEPAHVAKDS